MMGVGAEVGDDVGLRDFGDFGDICERASSGSVQAANATNTMMDAEIVMVICREH